MKRVILDTNREKLWRMFHGEYVCYMVDYRPANSGLWYLNNAVFDSRNQRYSSVIILEQEFLYDDGEIYSYHMKEGDDYE